MVRFGLIRHAKTQWNIEKKLQGREDIPLAPEGITQAGQWADTLKKKEYDFILSSPMARALKTAQIVGGINHWGVEIEEGLREQDFGDWEGQKIKDIRIHSPGRIEREESKGWEFCPPSGEVRIRVLKRAFETLKTVASEFENKKILVVCHSSVIKSLVYKTLDRNFLPGEPAILKNYHLHELRWNKTLEIEKLNSMKLSRGRTV